jgi:capsular polysaccharide biosynthesis protein
MELKQIIKNLKKYKIALLLSAVVGVLAGLVFYLAPKTYYATGSLYVTRAIDDVKFKYFAYEGYYAQQTGVSHTNNVLSLIDSLDTRNESLRKLNLPVDTNSLRKYATMIKAKKSGPQLITLMVKGKTADQAEKLWKAVTEVTLEKDRQINLKGDPLLNVSKVSDNPVVKDQYKPLWLCIVFGFIFAPSLLILGISIKEYFKWK